MEDPNNHRNNEDEENDPREQVRETDEALLHHNADGGTQKNKTNTMEVSGLSPNDWKNYVATLLENYLETTKKLITNVSVLTKRDNDYKTFEKAKNETSESIEKLAYYALISPELYQSLVDLQITNSTQCHHTFSYVTKLQDACDEFINLTQQKIFRKHKTLSEHCMITSIYFVINYKHHLVIGPPLLQK